METCSSLVKRTSYGENNFMQNIICNKWMRNRNILYNHNANFGSPTIYLLGENKINYENVFLYDIKTH